MLIYCSLWLAAVLLLCFRVLGPQCTVYITESGYLSLNESTSTPADVIVISDLAGGGGQDGRTAESIERDRFVLNKTNLNALMCLTCTHSSEILIPLERADVVTLINATVVGRRRQTQQLRVKRWLLCSNKKQSAETAWNSRDTMYKSWMHLGNCSIWNKEPQGCIIEHNLWSEASLISHAKQKLRYDWYRLSLMQASHLLILRKSLWHSPVYKVNGLTT